MHIKTAALLSTVVACTVSCATGSVTDLPETSPSAKPPALFTVETPEDPPAAPASTSTPSTPAPPPPPPSPPPPSPPPSPPAPSTEIPGSYSLDVACADLPVIHLCILASHAEKDVTFHLPEGTKRSSIVYTIDPQGPAASGSVTFASTDPLDATVHMSAFADAFSSVQVHVTGVMAVPE